MNDRIFNLTIGRFFSCLFTSFCLIALIRCVSILMHMDLPAWLGGVAFFALFMSRLWKVCEYPPPQPPFSHM